MKTNTLGTSNIQISEISIGCMSLPTSLAAAQPIIDTALDYGITYFDTADLYDKGVNEEIVGTLLKPHRQRVQIATKVGNRWTKGVDGWTWDPSPAHIENGLKESLRRLQTDYIDVYQLHGGTINDPWDDIIETFEKLQQEGLIRAYGISSIRPNVFVPFLQHSNAISNMMQFSLLDRRLEEWFDTIKAAGASVVTRGSLAKGLLTSDWRNRLRDYEGYTKDELASTLERLSQHDDLHALALAFNLQFDTVASTVIGASSKEQLDETLRAYKRAATIDAAPFKELTKQHHYTDHR